MRSARNFPLSLVQDERKGSEMQQWKFLIHREGYDEPLELGVSTFFLSRALLLLRWTLIRVGSIVRRWKEGAGLMKSTRP